MPTVEDSIKYHKSPKYRKNLSRYGKSFRWFPDHRVVYGKIWSDPSLVAKCSDFLRGKTPSPFLGGFSVCDERPLGSQRDEEVRCTACFSGPPHPVRSAKYYVEKGVPAVPAFHCCVNVETGEGECSTWTMDPDELRKFMVWDCRTPPEGELKTEKGGDLLIDL